MTATLDSTPANRQRLRQAETAWNELLAAVLKRGFHGTASLEVSVQDGTIQHLRRRVEQIEK